MLVSTLLIISTDDGYSMVDARIMSRYASVVRRCLSYASDWMYLHQHNGLLLGMVGVSSVFIVSYV